MTNSHHHRNLADPYTTLGDKALSAEILAREGEPARAALKSCPFCGGAADFGTRPNEKTRWSVHCDDCTAYRTGGTEVEAIAAWNQRPADPHCEALAGCLEEVVLSILDGEVLTAVECARAALAAYRGAKP